MTKLHFGNCPDCGQRVIRRGHSVLNVRGTPINHHLSCTGPQAPDGQDGPSVNKEKP